MATLVQPALVLADPVDGVRAAVENTRFGLPLVASVAAGSLASFAYYLRWDSAAKVIGAAGSARMPMSTPLWFM